MVHGSLLFVALLGKYLVCPTTAHIFAVWEMMVQDVVESLAGKISKRKNKSDKSKVNTTRTKVI